MVANSNLPPRWVRASLACLVLLASATGSTTWAATPETPKLRIGVIPIAGLTPIFAANKLGYLRDEGLEVTLEASSGGAQSLPLVVQGTLQISNAPVVSVALATQQGFDLRMLPPSLDEKSVAPAQTADVVLKDGPIKTVADLKGKRIAVNTINSVNWLYDRAFLQKHGLNPAEVTYVELPFPAMIDALLNGNVDAVNIPPPFHQIAMATGKARELGFPFFEIQPGLPITAFAATSKWLAANPVTTAAFIKAMGRAVDYMKENPVQAKELIAEYTKSKPELISQLAIDIAN
jgi:NitT/TauT family transport system substrate-binding protein